MTTNDIGDAPAGPRLRVGDPAPNLSVEDWLIGEPVERPRPGRVYLMEFWAIWCGPCLGAIPHLTEIQRKHPAVEVLSFVERKPDVAQVRALVAEKTSEIGYRVALQAASAGAAESDRGRMVRDWLDASCSTGVPTTFLVDAQGRIAWIGHPIAVEEPLAALLEGRYDLAAAIAEDRVEGEKRWAEHQLLAALAMRDKDAAPAASFAAFDALAERYPEIAGPLEHSKLFFFDDKDDVLAVAETLAARAAGDPERLAVIAFAALNTRLGPGRLSEGASDAQIAAFAAARLREVEPMLRKNEQRERSARTADEKQWLGQWAQFHDALSRAYAGLALIEDARLHGREAARLGRAMEAPAQWLEMIERRVDAL